MARSRILVTGVRAKWMTGVREQRSQQTAGANLLPGRNRDGTEPRKGGGTSRHGAVDGRPEQGSQQTAGASLLPSRKLGWHRAMQTLDSNAGMQPDAQC